MLSGLISLKLNCLLFETYPSQWKPNINNNVHIVVRRGSTLGQGGTCPSRLQIHLLPLPQIQKLADNSDVISEVPKCSKIQIFRGSAPDAAEGAYSAPQTPYLMGRGLAPPCQEPHPRSRPFGPRVYVHGPTHYRVVNPMLMIDFKCRPI